MFLVHLEVIGVAEWSLQRNWLAQEKGKIQDRMENSGQYGLDDSMMDELGELSAYDNHPADIASELFERGKDVALRDMDKLRLQEIDRAQNALNNGTYGTCQRCGETIPTERLEAYPLATLCVPCKQVDEREHPDRSRPVEEELLTPGFGRTDTDDTSSVVFDGEDAWQAVARFNQRPEFENNVQPHLEDDYMDDNEGIVDAIDAISNEEYESQLPS
jgi:DnaK suppressor protein